MKKIGLRVGYILLFIIIFIYWIIYLYNYDIIYFFMYFCGCRFLVFSGNLIWYVLIEL